MNLPPKLSSRSVDADPARRRGNRTSQNCADLSVPLTNRTSCRALHRVRAVIFLYSLEPDFGLGEKILCVEMQLKLHGSGEMENQLIFRYLNCIVDLW
jgi:hypothetical protein